MTLTFEQKFTNYVDLIVRRGANVQPGQIVHISMEVFHRELSVALTKRCYEVGAKYVLVDLIDPQSQRLRILHTTVEDMDYAPPFLTAKYDELIESTGATIRILGPEEPNILADLDTKKINVGRVAQYRALRAFYEEGVKKSKVHWTLAAAATPAWALKVFPEHDASRATAELWQTLFQICRVDSADYLARWDEHSAALCRRAAILTDLRIGALHFVGPGTDLVVGLSARAIFRGGGDASPRGVHFEPNIPTEECFTTPDATKTEGVAATTRPFLVNGKMVRGLKLEFRRGELINFTAAEGAETFLEYLESDPGARRLGEVALVGTDSPIFQAGRVFEEILLDENAACHIAIGSAYKFCLQDGDTLSAEELSRIGCNESSVHTDMMISNELVSVIARLENGAEKILIKDGKWRSL